MLQTGALPLGYVTRFVCPNIIAKPKGFVKPFLKLFIKIAFLLFDFRLDSFLYIVYEDFLSVLREFYGFFLRL